MLLVEKALESFQKQNGRPIVLTTNPLAGVRSQMKAVGAQLIQLFIVPNRLVDKWVTRKT